MMSCNRVSQEEDVDGGPFSVELTTTIDSAATPPNVTWLSLVNQVPGNDDGVASAMLPLAIMPSGSATSLTVGESPPGL